MTALGTWTDEQLRAIDRRDGDLLLDASAGSGKTSVLVERFVRAVLDDGIDAGAILAITFTEKAAAELRDRIRARLRELGESEQARATEGAFISTIHGFCARVLRAGALAAGLDPGFVVLDRDQSQPLAVAAFEEALADSGQTGGAGAVALVADYGAGVLRDSIFAVYAKLRSRGELVPRLPPCPPPEPAPAGELEDAARAVVAELAAISEPGTRIEDALARLERCRELVRSADLWPGELDRLKLPGNGAALGTDACAAYGEALARYRAAGAARAAGPVRDQLDALLAAFGDRYAERKRAVSGVDFEDLELITLELLRTRAELCEDYAQRFARIMVDEFQDTNRVQLALIESIARDNLFTVGDAQQSIYRFRHAEVELFEARARHLGASGDRATLRVNFRSRPEILAAVNAAFETELGDGFAPLVAGRAVDDGDETDPRVQLLLVDKGADWELEGLASPWRLAEAGALADRVAQLVADGTRPGEVVVLIRATTDMRAYERALERRGLPTYVIGGRGYWLHPQVLDMVCYLRALANPLDEESLYTVLTSPLVGASIDAVVVLAGSAREHETDPWSVLRGGLPGLEALDRADRDALTGFVTWFVDERDRSARAGLEDLIDGALTATGYDLSILAMPGGRRRLANVRKLMRLARDYEFEHGPDLRGFLAALSERQAGRAADSRESEAPVEGEALDAVRLMTIHRAKGLEFDTVCVADLGRSSRPPYELVRVGSDGSLGIRLARSGVGRRTSALDYDTLGAQEREADEREERRLFYVAMTRARERLILSGATRFEGFTDGRWTGGGPIAWIAPAFVPDLGRLIADGGGTAAVGGSSVLVTVAVPNGLSPPAPGPAAAGSERSEPGEPEPPPQPATPGPAVQTISYSALAAYARCGYRFYAERVLGLPPVPDPEPAGDGAGGEGGAAERGAAERGVLLHALLERLAFRAPLAPSPEAVAAAAAGAGLASPSPAEAQSLAGVVARFADSELCRRLGRATEVRREQRFAFSLQEQMLVTGAIDVLAREPGGRTLVVDYKSDRLDGADPELVVASAYPTQRLVYALAALHAGAEEVEVAYCFLERPESPVIASFHRSSRAELQRELQGLAAGIVQNRFEVSPTPNRGLCAGCPAEGGLCRWPLQMTRRESADRLF